MSRKKFGKSKIFCDRLLLLMAALGFKHRQHGVFAKETGITGSYLSDILNLKSGPSFGLIYGISDKFPQANIHWLLTGEGEMLRKDRDDPSIYRDALDEDPEVSRFLKKTREIIKSGTEYAFSLKANIGSFHNAMLLERKVQDHEARIARVEKLKPVEPNPPDKRLCEKKDTGT